MPPIVLLHLSDLHFGPHSRFQGEDPKQLGEQFHREMVAAQKKLGIEQKIDLVAVTGDVAEAGKRSELETGREFLTTLSGELGLGPSRFVFVPGNHDVNWGACKAAEAELERDEKLTEENLRRRLDEVKLDFYLDFLKRFYGVDDLTEVCEPLSRGARLYRYQDLGVAVAALSSCERESHRPADHRGEIGREQAEAAMAALRRKDIADWIKAIAVHHNPDVTTRNNLEGWKKHLAKVGKLDADILARYESDAVGLEGRERLHAIAQDAQVQLLLHGHHHAQDKRTWDWKPGPGHTHVISAGSLALLPKVLPKDEPASARLIILDPEKQEIRARSLVSLAWNRVPGSVTWGGFAADPASDLVQRLDLPAGFEGATSIGPIKARSQILRCAPGRQATLGADRSVRRSRRAGNWEQGGHRGPARTKRGKRCQRLRPAPYSSLSPLQRTPLSGVSPGPRYWHPARF